ncbi:MAG: CxxxxCH/CxxCH domain-containing protein [Fidelibacterota bacterium]
MSKRIKIPSAWSIIPENKGIFLFLILFLAIYGCSERETPTEFKVHPSYWMDSESSSFHGEKVARDGLDFCISCHGKDLKGGSADVSCYSCHKGGPGGHPGGWVDPASENFHGSYVAANSFSSCNECHGKDYRGGTSDVSCYSCHAGGPSGHPELVKWRTPIYAEFHGWKLKTLGWDISSCKNCHGSDYAGGWSDISCNRCHINPGGPEACNTCHGNFKETGYTYFYAPPEDLEENTDTEEIGVGAHQYHLRYKELSDPVECGECHSVPSTIGDSGHLSKSPSSSNAVKFEDSHIADVDAVAEVKFGNLATHSGEVQPEWDRENATCSEVYCHGNFSFSKDESDYPEIYQSQYIKGNSFNPKWTEVGTGQDQCGTCHDLPPQGHGQETLCYQGHSGVVDENRNIVDPSKHINGEKNVYGN